MSDEPHYFGVATIEQEPYQDEESEKGDLYVAIENFTPFAQAVPNKLPGTDDYIETIPPETRQSNYWRDGGVRPIDKATFEQIIALAGVDELMNARQLGGMSMPSPHLAKKAERKRSIPPGMSETLSSVSKP